MLIHSISSGTERVAKGGGDGEGAPSLGFSGPRRLKARECQISGGNNRNPYRSHEICAETDKKARQGSRGPTDHLGPPEKNRAPLTTRGPPNCQGPLSIRGPLTIRGPPNCQGPSDNQGPLWTSRALWSSGLLWLTGDLPAVKGPLNIRGPLMACLKLGALKIPTFLKFISFYYFVNLGPSWKIVDQIRGLFSIGQGLPWAPGNTRPPPPPWPNPSYVPESHIRTNDSAPFEQLHTYTYIST